MSTGLLLYKPASALAAEELIEEQRREQERRQRSVESSLASQIRKAFDHAKTAKQPIEERLLDCARRHKGVYDDDKLRSIQEEGGSTLYPKITATKCRAGTSWISDILMPSTGRPWGLEPTPLADIPPEFLQLFAQRMAQEEAAAQAQIQPKPDDIQGELGQQQLPPGGQMPPEMQGQQPPVHGMDGMNGTQNSTPPGLQGMPGAAPGQMPPEPTFEQIERAKAKIRTLVQQKAREVAARHEEVIADQLAEGGWQEALESFIADFCIYPAAFMRGPLMQKVPEMQWQDGWTMVEVDSIKPHFARVSPFDLYPSPDATDIDDGSYIIERERYTRTGLNKLRGVPGYKNESVEAVLEEYGRGGLRDWLSSDSQRARIEDRQHDWLNNNGETIEGLHYWGSAQGLTLLQWGMSPEQITDPLGEYEIDAILIGNQVIRCVINRNPMGSRPYHKASFHNVPGSFWGLGIPELMTDVQDMCCAVARAQANNLAFSAGPQIEVATDRLMPEEDPNEIYPMKRWRTKSDRTGTGTGSPAIRFYQPASMAGEFMQVYSQWEQRADDATNIPRYAYGNAQAGGAGNTASGLSMLFESANKGIKDAIRHIDRGVTKRVIQALWLHNMRYSDDISIKGDCRVIPQGANAQLLRDQTQNARQQFLAATGNDMDMQILGMEGRAALLRAVSVSLDMPDLVPDEETLKAKMAQQQEQQAQQGQAQAQQAEQAQQVMMQKMQIDAGKAQAETMQKQAVADKTQAETQKILLEIQGLVSQLTQLGIINGAQPQPTPGPQPVGEQQPPGMGDFQGNPQGFEGQGVPAPGGGHGAIDDLQDAGQISYPV